MRDFTSNPEFLLLRGTNRGLKHSESIDTPHPVSWGSRDPSVCFLSNTLPSPLHVVEGALGGSGKGLRLPASHQPWLAGRRCWNL